MTRALALALTALTGASGLVYEVAWQKYLATLLGSHSEATAAVLGIFLGGLSVGYWLFGAVTRRIVERAQESGRPAKLLLVYGILEAGIGTYVIAFPTLFGLVQRLSHWLPFGEGAGGVGFAVDVLLSALLIGPPSVLMGGTIPMLTQALARSLEDATRFHAFVYAFNTIGAFAGALGAGFYLLPVHGLEAVMLRMGFINLGAGAVFALSGLWGRPVVSLARDDADSTGRIEGFGTYAGVALLTGFAMMTMQTTINRIGLLAIGSSEFTFSMVVAVFVLAIALGSFAVSAFAHIPRMSVVLNQWAIALLLLLLYPWLDESPYFVMLIRTLFSPTDPGFFGYHFFLLVFLLVAVGIPVMLSGAALPLLFHHMRRQVGHLGDLAGYLYSWNTVGSLAGATLGGYALFFWLDLDEIYRVAIAALLVAATMLTVRVYRLPPVATAALLPFLFGLFLMPAWNTETLHSGLFRRPAKVTEDLFVGAEKFAVPLQKRLAPTLLFQTDDPTTSVLVREFGGRGGPRSRGILTNGKSDGDTIGDYGTTGLLAALPAMLAKKAERAFVIGWGLGTTAGELGSFETMQRVDVAEISRGVLEAAHFFDFATQAASKNPKIHTIQSDAYRALMRTNATYDVIVSGPSHVWVAGVEMLFSLEFLQATRAALNPGGVYCLYLHRYELDDRAMRIALRTFTEVYQHVSVWQDVNQSLLVLGITDPGGADHFRFAKSFERPDFKATLGRSKIPSLPALLAHELVPLGVLNAVELDGPLQTLHHPRLNYLAGRALFRRDTATPPFTGYGEPARIGAKNSLLRGYASRFGGQLPDEQRAEVVRETCKSFRALCSTVMAEWMAENAGSKTFEDTLAWVERRPHALPRERLEEMARLFADPRGGGERTSAYEARHFTEDFLEYYHHAAPFRGEALVDVWASCREGGASQAACVEQAEQLTLLSRDPSITFDERVEACLAAPSIGHRCQSGYDSAQALVEQGTVPTLEPLRRAPVGGRAREPTGGSEAR